MKEILFLIPSLQGGGAEKVLVDLVNGLDQTKYAITVQTVLNQSKRSYLLKDGIRYKSIIKSKRAFVNRLLMSLIIRAIPAKSIYKHCVRDHYDIEIAFLEGIATKIIAASDDKRSRKLAWVHTDLVEFPDSVKQFASFQENLEAYRKYDSVACVSETVKERFVECFGEACKDIHTVYNVVDDDEIREKARIGADTQAPEPGIPLLVACGRLCRQKAFDRLIRIHERLSREGVENRLWIIGEGSERKDLERIITDYGLEKTVTLWGYRENPYPLIRQASVLVCSSVAEGYSMVATEAVVLGVPVISTDVAGIREPYACPRCCIITENNENALYDAIKRVLTEPALLQKCRDETAQKAYYFRKQKLIAVAEQFIGGEEV